MIVARNVIPEELWMMLENDGRECEQCGKRFFGMGMRGKVTRTIKHMTTDQVSKKWVLDVTCCGVGCFDMAGKDE